MDLAVSSDCNSFHRPSSFQPFPPLGPFSFPLASFLLSSSPPSSPLWQVQLKVTQHDTISSTFPLCGQDLCLQLRSFSGPSCPLRLTQPLKKAKPQIINYYWTPKSEKKYRMMIRY